MRASEPQRPKTGLFGQGQKSRQTTALRKWSASRFPLKPKVWLDRDHHFILKEPEVVGGLTLY